MNSKKVFAIWLDVDTGNGIVKKLGGVVMLEGTAKKICKSLGYSSYTEVEAEELKNGDFLVKKDEINWVVSKRFW